jgi:hypothetical protein
MGPSVGLGDMKILDPTGTPTPSVVQPVASRYTDCATQNIYPLLWILKSHNLSHERPKLDAILSHFIHYIL